MVMDVIWIDGHQVEWSLFRGFITFRELPSLSLVLPMGSASCKILKSSSPACLVRSQSLGETKTDGRLAKKDRACA